MLCVPMDHGISIGPVSGLNNISETINQVDIGGASAILTHKGIIKSLTTPPNTGVIIHLSASTDIGLSPNRKLQVCSVEEAIRLGADAVSVHVNIGGKEESEMLKFKNFGRKSLTELTEKLGNLELKFGMDISIYLDE